MPFMATTQGYTLWASAVSVCPIHGKTVTEVTTADILLASYFLGKELEKPLQGRPIPFWPLRTTIHSNTHGKKAGLCSLPLHTGCV